jgi:hypothetical protein
MSIEEEIGKIALALKVQSNINYRLMDEIDAIKARLCKLEGDEK